MAKKLKTVHIGSDVSFKKGGLHKSVGVPQGTKIPEDVIKDAKMGKYGPLAQKQANFAEGMLKSGQDTAKKNRRKNVKKQKVID